MKNNPLATSSFPQALREWRGAFSARQAARALEVPRRTYEGWEYGRLTSARLIAYVLIKIETPIAALLGDEAPRQRGRPCTRNDR